jgi:predicted oxidoreductase
MDNSICGCTKECNELIRDEIKVELRKVNNSMKRVKQLSVIRHARKAIRKEFLRISLNQSTKSIN